MPPSPAQTSPYPQTGSYLYQTSSSTINRTGVALSTMIIIKVGDLRIGAIQKLTLTEARPIGMFNEVGTDGNIDSAPTGSTVHTGTCERLRFDGTRITEAFGSCFLHIKSQRIPFDVEIIDQYNGAAGSGQELVTVLKNVWFKDTTYSYDKDNWVVSESASISFETISSHIGGLPAATGGVRGSSGMRYDPYELASDICDRRGSMDAPGLISAVFSA
jgi:hypothetical protein